MGRHERPALGVHCETRRHSLGDFPGKEPALILRLCLPLPLPLAIGAYCSTIIVCAPFPILFPVSWPIGGLLFVPRCQLSMLVYFFPLSLAPFLLLLCGSPCRALSPMLAQTLTERSTYLGIFLFCFAPFAPFKHRKHHRQNTWKSVPSPDHFS